MIFVGIYVYFLIKERGQNPLQIAAKPSEKIPAREVLKNKDITIASLNTFLYGIRYGALLFMTIPLLREKLSFTLTKIGWVISALGWEHVGGALVFGPLSDKLGRRKSFGLISSLWSGIFIILFAFSQNLRWMVAINGLFGFISGPCSDVLPAMKSELDPTSPPAASIGVQQFGEQFRISLGPVVGGSLIAMLGYQGAIICYGGIMIVGSIVFQMGVAEPRKIKAK